jgi:hypothetical protein
MHDDVSHLRMEDILESEWHLFEVMGIVGGGAGHKAPAVAKRVVGRGCTWCARTSQVGLEVGHRDTSLMMLVSAWKRRWNSIVPHRIASVPGDACGRETVC